MTEDNGKKLTLSGKSTLTLKKTNLQPKEGRKTVQVEVRKKRFVTQPAQAKPAVEIDDELAQKLELLAKAKEHDAKRKLEEEEKEIQRQKQKEEAEALRKQKEAEESEKAKKKEEKAEKNKAKADVTAVEKRDVNEQKSYGAKHKDKKDDYDDEDDDEYYAKKGKKVFGNESNKPLTREEAFEQERRKIQKRSFETPKRNNKINVNSYMFGDDEDDDYGYGAPRRRFKKKAPKPQVQAQAPCRPQALCMRFLKQLRSYPDRDAGFAQSL